jgi:hypothetical protein
MKLAGQFRYFFTPLGLGFITPTATAKTRTPGLEETKPGGYGELHYNKLDSKVVFKFDV